MPLLLRRLLDTTMCCFDYRDQIARDKAIKKSEEYNKNWTSSSTFQRDFSERGMDEVTFFYVGDLFCIHLDTKKAKFQEKISAEISGKKWLNFSL